MHLTKNITVMALFMSLAAFDVTPAVEMDHRVAARAAAGFDSNPLRVPAGETSGAFSELGLETGLGLGLAPRTRLFVELDALTRLHPSQPEADFALADLRVGFNLKPLQGEKHSIAMSIGALAGLRRLTYVDRGTGSAYEILEDPNSPQRRVLPDRLDMDRTGLFLNTQWRLNRRLRLFVDSVFERNDFVEDYDDSAVLDSLDHDRLVVTPGAQVVVHRRARLTLSASYSSANYDARPARDVDGNSVPGVQSQYRYLSYRMVIDIMPAAGWQTGFGFNGLDRDDLHAGYYDYAGRGVFAYVRNDIGPRSQWQLFSSLRELDYSNAIIDIADPASELRQSDVLRIVGRVDRRFQERFSLYVETGFQTTENTDPIYAYDRNWGMVGFEYRR